MSTHETIDSMIAYTIAGGGVLIAKHVDKLEQAANHAHDITLILAAGIAAIRIVYDGIRLVRFIRRLMKPDKEND